jgi:hypothetical protein
MNGMRKYRSEKENDPGELSHKTTSTKRAMFAVSGLDRPSSTY